MLREDVHSRERKVALQLAFGTGVLPSQNAFYLCSGGLMDKVADSDSADTGSIPVRSANSMR